MSIRALVAKNLRALRQAQCDMKTVKNKGHFERSEKSKIPQP